MYKITAITEEGSVKLKKYLDDGSLENKVLVSKFDIFTRKYKLAKGRAPRELLEGWPENDVAFDEGFQQQRMLAAVTLLLADMYWSMARPSVALQTQPKKACFVNEAYKKGAFKIPIFGRVVALSKSSSEPEGRRLEHGRMFKIEDTSVNDCTFYVKLDAKDNVAANYVNTTSDESKVNTAVDHKAAELVIQKKKMKVQLPLLVKTCALKVGDELVLKRADASSSSLTNAVKRHATLSIKYSDSRQFVDKKAKNE